MQLENSLVLNILLSVSLNVADQELARLFNAADLTLHLARSPVHFVM
jgi:hypothetical protein